jgi:hypothetical protein
MPLFESQAVVSCSCIPKPLLYFPGDLVGPDPIRLLVRFIFSGIDAGTPPPPPPPPYVRLVLLVLVVPSVLAVIIDLLLPGWRSWAPALDVDLYFPGWRICSCCPFLICYFRAKGPFRLRSWSVNCIRHLFDSSVQG